MLIITLYVYNKLNKFSNILLTIVETYVQL